MFQVPRNGGWLAAPAANRCGLVFHRPRVLLLGVVLVVASLSLPAQGEQPPASWSQWRGAGRDGLVAGAVWPDGLRPERLEKLWRVELGPGYSGPVIAGETVFVTETRDKKTEHVRALDRQTGRELWQASWEGSMSVPFFAASNGSWIRATPAVAEGRIYVAGMRDILVCLDAATGAEIWRVDFTTAFESPLPAFGFVSSPLLLGDSVYVQAGGGFVRLDKGTGKVIWRVMADGGGMNGSAFSSPFFTTLGGVPQILVQGREELAGIDPEQGTILWKTPVEAFRGMNIVTPTVSEGKVFTTSYGGGSYLFAVDPTAAAAAAEKAGAESVWRNKIQGYMSTPIIREGHAYVHLRNQRFACLDLASGKEDWITTPFGRYWSMVAQGDKLLTLDETGDLRLIRATPEKYDQLGEAKVAEAESWAHVAVVDAPGGGTEIHVRDLSGITAWRWK